MGLIERKALIEQLQEKRGTLVMTYVTSTRQNHEIQMADDVLRLLYEHLESNVAAAAKGVDLLIHSNGGAGTVPWRIANIIREYTKKFSVLVPHRAFSAATLTAVGADSIVMHKMGCLGPIDPSVTNVFNPPHPMSPGQLAPISVENVTAYFELVTESGISHQDELIQALLALTSEIHPLALGNVQRSHHQSRMMARKLLEMHMDKDHEIEPIIEDLKSNLFFHGHPINRAEAKGLNLKVELPSPDVERLMWSLYLDYERELKLREPYFALRELECEATKAQAGTVEADAILAEMGRMAKMGLQIGGQIPEERLVKMAAEIVRQSTGAADDSGLELTIPGAYSESACHSFVFQTHLNLRRLTVPSANGPQPGVQQELRWQAWERQTDADTPTRSEARPENPAADKEAVQPAAAADEPDHASDGLDPDSKSP